MFPAPQEPAARRGGKEQLPANFRSKRPEGAGAGEEGGSPPGAPEVCQDAEGIKGRWRRFLGLLVEVRTGRQPGGPEGWTEWLRLDLTCHEEPQGALDKEGGFGRAAVHDWNCRGMGRKENPKWGCALYQRWLSNRNMPTPGYSLSDSQLGNSRKVKLLLIIYVTPNIKYLSFQHEINAKITIAITHISCQVFKADGLWPGHPDAHYFFIGSWQLQHRTAQV